MLTCPILTYAGAVTIGPVAAAAGTMVAVGLQALVIQKLTNDTMHLGLMGAVPIREIAAALLLLAACFLLREATMFTLNMVPAG